MADFCYLLFKDAQFSLVCPVTALQEQCSSSPEDRSLTSSSFLVQAEHITKSWLTFVNILFLTLTKYCRYFPCDRTNDASLYKHCLWTVPNLSGLHGLVHVACKCCLLDGHSAGGNGRAEAIAKEHSPTHGPALTWWEKSSVFFCRVCDSPDKTLTSRSGWSLLNLTSNWTLPSPVTSDKQQPAGIVSFHLPRKSHLDRCHFLKASLLWFLVCLTSVFSLVNWLLSLAKQHLYPDGLRQKIFNFTGHFHLVFYPVSLFYKCHILLQWDRRTVCRRSPLITLLAFQLLQAKMSALNRFWQINKNHQMSELLFTFLAFLLLFVIFGIAWLYINVCKANPNSKHLS